MGLGCLEASGILRDSLIFSESPRIVPGTWPWASYSVRRSLSKAEKTSLDWLDLHKITSDFPLYSSELVTVDVDFFAYTGCGWV